MSASIDVLFRQRILACSGLNPGPLDGIWGPKTDAADKAFHAESARLRTVGGTFDPRTEAAIETLVLKAQAKARDFMRVAGPTCKILSGTRTYAEQNALFAQRPVVTRARGGQSRHNFGIAFDVGIFLAGHYLTGATRAEEGAYTSLGAKVKSNVDNIDWGGDWTGGFKDYPHYELRTGKTVAQVRALFESGKPIG